MQWAPLRTMRLVCLGCQADYLPSWSNDTVASSGEEKEEKSKRKIDFVQWISAFQAYALAADAAEACAHRAAWRALESACEHLFVARSGSTQVLWRI